MLGTCLAIGCDSSNVVLRSQSAERDGYYSVGSGTGCLGDDLLLRTKKLVSPPGGEDHTKPKEPVWPFNSQARQPSSGKARRAPDPLS